MDLNKILLDWDNSDDYLRNKIDDLNKVNIFPANFKRFRIDNPSYYDSSGQRTHNNVTFDWNETWDKCVVTSTEATEFAFANMFHNLASLPYGIEAGKRYLFKRNTNDISIVLEVFFKDSSGNNIMHYSISDSTVVTVPYNAVGSTIRLAVNKNKVVNGTISDIEFIAIKTNEDLFNELQDVKNNFDAYLALL